MANGFVVTDEAELRALLKALIEAKFHPAPECPEVQGSSYVARLCERAVEAIAQCEESKGKSGNADRTRAWFRDVQNNLVLKAVRSQIAEHANSTAWLQWPIEKRVEFVRDLLSPYAGDDELVYELIDEAGRLPSTRTVETDVEVLRHAVVDGINAFVREVLIPMLPSLDAVWNAETSANLLEAKYRIAEMVAENWRTSSFNDDAENAMCKRDDDRGIIS